MCETRMLGTLLDELVLLVLNHLCAYDLCCCIGTGRRLHTLSGCSSLWQPIALWLPGVGREFAVAPLTDVPWRRVVATWTLWLALRTGRRELAQLRVQEWNLLREKETLFEEQHFMLTAEFVRLRKWRTEVNAKLTLTKDSSCWLNGPWHEWHNRVSSSLPILLRVADRGIAHQHAWEEWARTLYAR